MSRRDLGWRAAGLALTGGACGVAAGADGQTLSLLLFPLALAGLPLIVHGKRVGQALRAERRGHIHTAGAVHDARTRRHRRSMDRHRR